MVGGTAYGDDREETVPAVPSEHDKTDNDYMTASDEALLVLPKTIPIDILAEELKQIYFRHLE